MVLQRDRPIPVWGWTAPGAKVSVSLAGQSGTATANAQGEWIATLPALPAGGPHEMIVTGPEEVRFQNALVGEVWVCSGQSNMVMALSETDTAAEDIAAADYPQMSVLRLNARQAGLSEKVPQKPRPKWVPASPATASGFSAVAYS
ncbi:MAG: sialate O-acetylesterase, partial [Verrucomicrobiota bacterium]